jgi:hypothetical protein
MTAMPGRRRVGPLVCAAALTSALGTACTQGADDPAGPPATPSPTSTRTPSEQPVELALGEPASFRLTSGPARGARVRVAVTRVRRGDIGDLSEFVLDAESRRSTPYYADARVTNAGGRRLADASVTLWGLDSEGTVRPPAQVVGRFTRCQGAAAGRLGRGESVRTCFVYLLPRGSSLEAVQYRFNDKEPYSWPVR